MKHQQGSTSSTVLILLLVVVVGFIVWYVTSHNKNTQEQPAVQLNLGSGGGESDQ